jgi:hypothetical protein
MIGARITTLPSPTTLADRINPVFQRLDIGDEFTGLRHRRARRCGLIVAVQPFRAFRHRSIDPQAILGCDVRDRAKVLSLNARPKPFDDAVQKDFLNGAFPSFA